VFEEEPMIVNNHLKAKVGFPTLAQHRTNTIALQTLAIRPASSSAPDYVLEELLIAQGSSSPASMGAPPTIGSRVTFNEDLDRLNFDKVATSHIRLKVTVMHWNKHPKDWQRGEATVVFSKWLPYKKTQKK